MTRQAGNGSVAAETRLEGLIFARDALREQIADGGGTVAQCVAQYRAVLAEIDELQGAGAGSEGTVLSDFEQRLRAREAEAKSSRKRSS